MIRRNPPQQPRPGITDWILPSAAIAVIVWVVWLSFGCGSAAGGEPDVRTIECERLVQCVRYVHQPAPRLAPRATTLRCWTWYEWTDGNRSGSLSTEHQRAHMNYYGGQWHLSNPWGTDTVHCITEYVCDTLDYEIVIED